MFVYLNRKKNHQFIPLPEEDSNDIIFDKAFGQKMSERKIFNHITSIIKNHGIKPLYTSDISTIIAMNSGIGTVAVAYIRKD